MIEPTYEIDTFGGNCPVQAEGTCCGGRKFYFRARGEHLQMTIALQPGDEHPLEVPEEVRWYYEQEYGQWPDAGWISDETAHAFIKWACEKFVADNTLKPEKDAPGEKWLIQCASDRTQVITCIVEAASPEEAMEKARFHASGEDIGWKDLDDSDGIYVINAWDSRNKLHRIPHRFTREHRVEMSNVPLTPTDELEPPS